MQVVSTRILPPHWHSHISTRDQSCGLSSGPLPDWPKAEHRIFARKASCHRSPFEASRTTDTSHSSQSMASSNPLRPSLGRILHSCIQHPATAAARPSPSHALFPSVSRFSTTSRQEKRARRDMNRQRGVSTIYRSGPREPLSVSGEPLPRPVKTPPRPTVNADHGLWGFFQEPNKLMNTPEEDLMFGRPWAVNELRQKDWADLHSLWWLCVRERNRISTANAERARAEMGFGDYESMQRDEAVSSAALLHATMRYADFCCLQVRKTMKAIRHVLLERYYVWEDAAKLAKNDPEINLSGDGPAYTPQSFMDEEALSEEDYMETEEGRAAVRGEGGKLAEGLRGEKATESQPRS